MPLHPDDKATRRVFDSFDHTIGRKCHRTQITTGNCYRLMMVAIDFHFTAACKPAEKAIFCQPDDVPCRWFAQLKARRQDAWLRFV